MTSRDFCFWLQGFFELQETAEIPVGTIVSSNAFLQLGPKQVDTVKRHLALVFKHEIDPSMGTPAHQQTLDKIHAAPTQSVPPFPPANPGGLQFRC